MAAELLFAILTLPVLLSGYAMGPQNDACQDATPRHAMSGNTYYEPQQSCPYLVYFEEGFTPGETHTLTITSWTGEADFKGYMLLVLDENSKNVGEFGSDHHTICNGGAVTHSNSDMKLSEQVHWTAPTNSSGHTYHIWLTIVRSYSQFWVNCDPVILPANDVELNETTTPIELATDTNGDPIGFTWPPTLPPHTTTGSTIAETRDTTTTTRIEGYKENDATAKLPATLSIEKPDSPKKNSPSMMNQPQNAKSVMNNSAAKLISHLLSSCIPLLTLFILH